MKHAHICSIEFVDESRILCLLLFPPVPCGHCHFTAWVNCPIDILLLGHEALRYVGSHLVVFPLHHPQHALLLLKWQCELRLVKRDYCLCEASGPDSHCCTLPLILLSQLFEYELRIPHHWPVILLSCFLLISLCKTFTTGFHPSGDEWSLFGLTFIKIAVFADELIHVHVSVFVTYRLVWDVNTLINCLHFLAIHCRIKLHVKNSLLTKALLEFIDRFKLRGHPNVTRIINNVL